MNKVILIGNLTKDPEFQTTNSGISIARFTIAVQRKFENANGEKETDFLSVVAWRSLADLVKKYVKKGNKVCVCGSLQTRNFEAQDGSKKYVTEIIADEVEFLTQPQSEEKAQVKAEDIKDDDLPF